MGYEVRTCIIIGSAPMEDGSLFQTFGAEQAFVICADGGYDTAKRFGVRPDLLVGDFDSIRAALPPDVETIRLPVHKDDTDMTAAVKEGIRRGYRDFVLLGALGGARFDHSYSNLCTLLYLTEQGCRGVIAEKATRIFLLSGGRLRLDSMKGNTVSVFPFGGPSVTVSYEGLEYPLTEYPLMADVPLGVSNSITSDHALIFVHSGCAAIILSAAE